MKKKVLGQVVNLYTKRGFFYRGEVVDEDDTHIFLEDFKTKNEIMIARDWITQLTTETIQEVRE